MQSNLYSVNNDIHVLDLRFNSLQSIDDKTISAMQEANSLNNIYLNINSSDFKKYNQCTHLTFRTEKIKLINRSFGNKNNYLTNQYHQII